MGNLITASIVLFQSDVSEIKKNVDCILDTGGNIRLYLIDNSAGSHFSFFSVIDNRIEYIHNDINVGYGGGHNIALKKAIELGAKYHFVINPDICFKSDVIITMVEYMEINKEVGMMMPQILNEDGSIQFLPKLLPRPFDVIMRKLKWPHFYYKKFIERYEMRIAPNDIVYCTPVLSGCFNILRLESIKEVGMYDENYFMYFEDWDLSRRMFKKYKTVYYPKVSVYHGYESGASKKIGLFFTFLKSFFIYFNTWGWFIDLDRAKWNKYVLSQFSFLKQDNF
ncbi:glycosyltransferase family 2 protein [Flavobacterium sp. DGU38]|uniref:Glycosyltransferase family 2 protein n=1 Tax=Flavobacterium calami TaxID=3139144 RepID=A0ABU9IL51_9FLAO